jgi:TRAP-type C4-dicarboxylate transport system permease small subunit
MRLVILILIIVWIISSILTRRQIEEENIPIWLVILRIVLSPIIAIILVVKKIYDNGRKRKERVLGGIF